MIQWSSENLLIEDASGAYVSYDVERLRKELEKSFAAQGITESWMVEHLVLTMEEMIRSSNEKGEHLLEEDVPKILGNILLAAGYGEVASEYLRLYEEFEFFKPGELQKWTANEMREYLCHSFPLTDSQLMHLSEECVATIQTLGFSSVSATFLRELAVHLLHYQRFSENKESKFKSKTEGFTASCSMPRKPYIRQMEFITTDSWIGLVNAPGRALIEKKIICPLPLSDLFPKARLEFQVYRCEEILGGWNAELILLSRLPKIFQDTKDVLDCMRDHISRTWPKIDDPSGHIIFPAFEKFFSTEHLGGNKKRCQKFREEVETLVEKYLLKNTGYSLQVSYRK
ncbi:MAG: hypothetical protein WCS73_03850 [Lentisphaeria bacterium]